MSTDYRELRRAVDDVVAAEDGVWHARMTLGDAQTRMGRALRACREAKGLSLRECAKQLKLSAPYLSDVELGRRSISAGNLECLMGIVMHQFSAQDLIDAVKHNQIQPDDKNAKIK